MAGLPKGFGRGLLFGALIALCWGVLSDRRRRSVIGGEVMEKVGTVPLLGPRLSAVLLDRLMEGLYRAVAEDVVAQVRAGELLEFGEGSGRVAVELARRARDLQITAMEPTSDRVQLAEQRVVAAGLGRQVKVVLGAASDIPFPEGSYDHVVSFQGLRKGGAPEVVLAELHRVLRPGGRAWVYDFRRETPQEAWDLVGQKLSLPMRQIFDSAVLAQWAKSYNEAQLGLYAADSPFKEVALQPIPAVLAGVQIQALTRATFQR